jgi:hypothetical protein
MTSWWKFNRTRRIGKVRSSDELTNWLRVKFLILIILFSEMLMSVLCDSFLLLRMPKFNAARSVAVVLQGNWSEYLCLSEWDSQLQLRLLQPATYHSWSRAVQRR